MEDRDGPERYRYLTFNAPLSGWRADAIADRLAASAPARVLDIGCGWAELLLRVLVRAVAATGTGVDTDGELLRRAEQRAGQLGLADRVRFERTSGDRVSDPADVVINIGASHAFGDTTAALRALRSLVRPGGRLLFGEAYWRPDANVDSGLVWTDMRQLPDLPELVDLAVAEGYRPLYIEASNPDEMDAFESGFSADQEEWLVAHAEHPDAASVRAAADEHRTRWLRGYRGAFGFAYLTLGVPAR